MKAFALLIAFLLPELFAEEIIIDNTDRKQVKLFGRWILDSELAGFIGKNYAHDNGVASKKGLYVRFEPVLPADGEYEILLHVHAHDRRAPQTFIDISAGGTIISKAVNLQEMEAGWSWLSLAKLTLKKDDVLTVTVNAEGTEGTYVVVDALKLVKSPE